MMLRSTAAAYLDLSEAALEKEVGAGRLPPPVLLGARLHWDRDQIDEALAKLSGSAEADWRTSSPLYTGPSYKGPGTTSTAEAVAHLQRSAFSKKAR